VPPPGLIPFLNAAFNILTPPFKSKNSQKDLACVFMPRKGFKVITVPSDLYENLKIIAEYENRSIADIIKLLLYHKNLNLSLGFVNRWSGVQTPSGAPPK
jgi:predicted CopG family antitoxin